MATNYRQLIASYCESNGIVVPPGFARNTPSRYAIIRTHCTPQKLIATTWFKVSDVLYYIKHFLEPELGEKLSTAIRILDFGDEKELGYSGGNQLRPTTSFQVPLKTDD